MAVYPSIYRAKAVQVTGNTLTVYVPQVFGDVSVEITDFLSPPVAGMGWVFFQAGNPEHPVWTTRVASEGQADWSEEIEDLDTRLDVIEQGGGDSSDEVWVGSNAPIGGQELWYDPDVSGVTLFSGGGPSVNEVFVGPSDPIVTDPDIELWFDTDAVGALPEDQRWNTAWGIVAMGSLLNATGAVFPIPAATATKITAPLNYTTVVGRRYRLVCKVRAIVYQTAVGNFRTGVLDNGVDQYSTLGDQYTWIASNYDSHIAEFVFNGDGAAHSFEITATPSSAMNIYTNMCWYYLEDLGPVSSSAPVYNPTPVWQPLTLLNGWYVTAGDTPAQYRKIGDEVSIRGHIKNPGVATAGSIAVLPFGFRPPYFQPVNVAYDHGGTYDLTSLGIYTDGRINFAGWTGVVINYLTLSGNFSVTP